jgi:hypothetical protein
MATWVLIIIVSGGYNGSTPAVTSQEFHGQENCNKAQATMNLATIDHLGTIRTWCFLKN